MEINGDVLLLETRNEPKVLHTHGSATFEQRGRITQHTPISGMREQIMGKLEKGSCQGAYRLSVEDKLLYTTSLYR